MQRGVSPVVAIVLLIAVTVVGVAAVSTVATGLDDRASVDDPPRIAVSADPETGAITLAHRGGSAVNFSEHSLSIAVNGEPLAHQPPVPYFAAEGFQGAPSGPFNSGGEAVFESGETATLRIASTNAPQLDAGDRVTVTVERDGRRIADAEVLAGG